MFGDIFTELPAMVALHAEVRRQGLRTYILSNTNDLAVRHIQATFPFFRHFDGYVYSYEHRCLKPDVRLYEALEQVSGLRGSDLFYLDDRSENIAPAQQRGWQTLVHRSPKESRAALIRAGVLPAH
jgi:HAD superfamily hydrolase (TIGR01509 family)